MSTNSEITRRNTVFEDSQLSVIEDFKAALDLAKQVNNEQVSDYGTGFMVLDDNAKLVGVPFIILQWAFNEGDFGEFVSAEIVTQNAITDNGVTGVKWILNDGSTGIYRQLLGVTEARTKAGRQDTHAVLAVPRGLTSTSYFYNEVTKETSSEPGEGKDWRPASTNYLAQ